MIDGWAEALVLSRMAINFLEEKHIDCVKCGKVTVHQRSNTKANWLLHIVIGLCTCGIWLALAALFRGATRQGPGKWTCSVCGTQKKEVPQILIMLVVAIILIVGAVVLRSSILSEQVQ